MSRLALRQVHWHKKHEQHSRDACRQAVHANGRGQAAPTTSPARPSALVRTNAHGCQKGTSMRFYAARMSNHANKCGQKQGVRRRREGVRRHREGDPEAPAPGCHSYSYCSVSIGNCTEWWTQLKTLCEAHDEAERAVAYGMLRRFATHPPASRQFC